MTRTLTRVHISDLHRDDADGRQNLDRLRKVVGQINRPAGANADLVLVPRINVNQRAPTQRIAVLWNDRQDEIARLVRDGMSIPKPTRPVTLGHDGHAIGEWAVAGIQGDQFGPNTNGRGW